MKSEENIDRTKPLQLNNNMRCIEIGLISYKGIGIQLNNNMECIERNMKFRKTNTTKRWLNNNIGCIFFICENSFLKFLSYLLCKKNNTDKKKESIYVTR